MVVPDLSTERGRRAVLERMLTIREFDDEVGERFSDGEIPGFVHLYLGQEAVAVGATAALDDDDYITSTHRGHGHCIAKGLDPSTMMAEIYGREAGYCYGKGGSMHIADVDAGMLGANGIVGAGPPIATGAALSIDLREDDGRVALAFYGDAAAAEGPVHEAINLAAVWDLPVVFLIENNQYGEALPFDQQFNVEQLSEMAAAYGIPGETVDGMDVGAVHEAVDRARKRALAGEGPTIVEAETYRYRGHFVGDPESYRDEAEVEEWRERDPLRSFREELAERGELTDAEFEELRAEVRDRIADAVEFAKTAEDPEPRRAYTDVFADPAPEIERFSGHDVGASRTAAPDAPAETESITFRAAIRAALREEMQRDEDVFLLGEDVGAFGGVFNVTAGLREEFGADRTRDTPLSEAVIVGAGVGAAATGTRPVAEIMFSDFIGLATEQITNQAAKMRYMFGGKVDMPLTVRTTEGGGMGAASQHSGTVHSWFAHAPGVKAVTPGTPAAAKSLLKASIRSEDPVVFFENKTQYDQQGEVPTDPDHVAPLGRASVEREGTDVTVVATQRLVGESLSVADDLAGDVDVEVIDLRSLYPLDTETIVGSVDKTNRVVVADESPLSYGIHAEVTTRLVEDAFFSLEAPVQRVGVADTPVPFSAGLEQEVLPGAEDVREAIDRVAR
jgi:pyruvate/2-oxoglutarate/acetoin dehydrogenase E1 component/TPP-dependent pyruvate/acetoin dehydrogenase alpha subunit